MNLKLGAALMLVTLMLAGCSKEEAGPTAEEMCDGIWANDSCTPHTEPSIIITGLPETVSAYVEYTFTWTLDNGTRGTPTNPVHSMYNYLGLVTDGSTPDNSTDPEVTEFGMPLLNEALTHQNLPVSNNETFSWDVAGETVTLWGYMRIDSQNIWQNLGTISVVTPQSSGTTHTLTLDFDPMTGSASVDDDDISIFIGDAFEFDNQSDYTYEIDLSNCGEDDLTVAAGTTSNAVEILEPMSCNWNAASPLAAGPSDLWALDGVVRIKTSLPL